VSSYAFTAQAAPAWLQKGLTLPPETFVSVIGAAKVVQAPAAGASLMLQAANGSAFVAKAANLALVTSWQRLHVPLLTVGNGSVSTFVQFVASGSPAVVRIDDIRVQLGSWWEQDNLANLSFEWGCRFRGLAPTYWSAPDAWSSYQAICDSDPTVRPGAAPGSKSVRLTLQAGDGSVYKDLTFLKPGDTAVVSGWARGIGVDPGAAMQAIVGNGYGFYVLGAPNQHTAPLACDGVWRQFVLTYVVPNNPSFTRIYLGCYDTAGAQCWWDDIAVSIQ
jgi:hypothetical protein